MKTSSPFERHSGRYDQWFEEYDEVYRAELEAIQQLVQPPTRGVEIGVGTGRFGAPLGIEVGIDPARAMLVRARERGIEVVAGVAESLPFAAESFDTALLVTTICFVDDVSRTLAEAERVLEPGGTLVIGHIDANSPLGRVYEETKADSPFYRDAEFRSTGDLLGALEEAGFEAFEVVQTIFGQMEEIDATEPVKPGHGDGSFVVVAASG